ncbi:MAG TPA: hypothetical protein DCE77_08815 [Methylophaga sp.]|jgi:hypothetical protein|uniref:Uncharacterized protein n=1 Tax=Pseudidiomarina aestuarii TaxID=624146 RepID=A0A2T4CZ93_9GAMM|nr:MULTISPECIES: hypothetical protein [unclassified Methylophaga]MAP26378.1 hypothetical protein [Methylophaga sp.]PTB86897.1 hypothetical protein C9940_00295 [Pseudidiomarina aestuarii]HAD31667.1 hypothetical protein [Methylophaga sp.]HCO00159.1 hypothetical protein [Methylophaga sp.]|tara:strand:+ start:3390 stop:3710 length:321 start_codon:yes stop_codon:yes gene_type:complete
MKTLKSVLQPFNSTRLIPLLLAITLTACGSDFQEGAYVDPQYGTGYEFNAEGQGQLIGGVPGSYSFTYKVDSDEVVTSGDINLTFKRIDDKTLERPDGTRLILKED